MTNSPHLSHRFVASLKDGSDEAFLLLSLLLTSSGIRIFIQQLCVLLFEVLVPAAGILVVCVQKFYDQHINNINTSLPYGRGGLRVGKG